MRYASKVDSTHKAIRQALRQCGIEVVDTSHARGFVDLVDSRLRTCDRWRKRFSGRQREGDEMSDMNSKRPVLVTTQHRGVFFGYLVGEPSKEQVVVDRVRNVTYWDAATRGFLGLASTGPTKGCRVTAAAGETTLYDITGVFTCTPDAVAAFEAGPWA